MIRKNTYKKYEKYTIISWIGIELDLMWFLATFCVLRVRICYENGKNEGQRVTKSIPPSASHAKDIILLLR